MSEGPAHAIAKMRIRDLEVANARFRELLQAMVDYMIQYDPYSRRWLCAHCGETAETEDRLEHSPSCEIAQALELLKGENP